MPHFHGAPAMALMTVGADALLVGEPLVGQGAVQAVGLVAGAPMGGVVMLWFALAIAVTLRTVCASMPFPLTWWSSVFLSARWSRGRQGWRLPRGRTSW